MLPPMSSEGAKAFIARWAAASASERANSPPFLCGLCDILGVATPEPTRETGYAFDYDAIEHHPWNPSGFSESSLGSATL